MKSYDDEFIAQADPQNYVFEMRDELLALRQWAQSVYTVLQAGVLLMDAEQLARWEGVRAVVESAPSYCVNTLTPHQTIVCPNCDTENDVPDTHNRNNPWWCLYCSFDILHGEVSG